MGDSAADHFSDKLGIVNLDPLDSVLNDKTIPLDPYAWMLRETSE